MTTDLQKIQQACIAANPGISALPAYPYSPDTAKAIVALEKLAQKTLWNSDIEQTATLMIDSYRQQQAGDYRAMLEGRWEGRLIGLADVLLAIGATPWIVACDDNGDLFQMDIGGRIITPAVPWNLREPLENQTPEVLSFIASLL